MANRQSAPAGVPADAHENTARALMNKSALPGWIWGTLGCLSVLGVGFGLLIVVARTGHLGGSTVGPAATAAAPTAPAPAPAPVGAPPRPQIEQLVPPHAAPSVPSAEVKRTPPHAIKLAHSPSGGHPAAAGKLGADKPTADKSTADKPTADKPSADKPTAEKPAAASDEAVSAKKPADKPVSDDDQVVRHHRPAPSDQDDDDD